MMVYLLPCLGCQQNNSTAMSFAYCQIVLTWLIVITNNIVLAWLVWFLFYKAISKHHVLLF